MRFLNILLDFSDCLVFVLDPFNEAITKTYF